MRTTSAQSSGWIISSLFNPDHSAIGVATKPGQIATARTPSHGSLRLVRLLPYAAASSPLTSGGRAMSFIAWIVLGLIAGAIAKALMPGKDPGGIIVTMIIGIVGAFIGGFLGSTLTGSGLNGFSIWSMVLAIVGAMLLLWIYRLATRNRTTSL